MAPQLVLAQMHVSARTFTTTASAYLLLLDPQGRERARWILPDKTHPVTADSVVANLTQVLASDRPALTGDALLRRLAKDERPRARRDAAKYVARANDPANIRRLIAFLSDSDPDTAGDAASGLSRLGARAKSSTPALEAVARDTSRSGHLRATALRALSKIEPRTDSLRVIAEAGLRDSDHGVVRAAARALTKMRRLPARLVPVVMEAWLRHDLDFVREALADLLALFGDGASAALPLLRAVPVPTTPNLSPTSANARLARAARAAIREIERAR